MKIKLTLPENAAGFIRHARHEALVSIGGEIRPELLEPTSCAMYLLAYGSDQSKPIGLAEFAFYDQVYRSFDDTPYPDTLGLAEIGPFDEFAGTRTLFVEHEARSQMPPYYLMLAMAGSWIAYQSGARYTTASTNADNEYLMRLYSKTGGRLLGTYRDDSQSAFGTALFVFEIERLVRHPAMRRLANKVEFDPQIARTIRSRSLWSDDRKIA